MKLPQWSLWDPDDYATKDLPRVLRLPHRLYGYLACRVTGHAAHALNGVLCWLPFSPLVPLAWFWPLPVAFYTLRDALRIRWGDPENLDHLGDVVWVYALGVALWLPWWALMVFLGGVVVPVQRAAWLHRAPVWMPRKSLLWGRA